MRVRYRIDMAAAATTAAAWLAALALLSGGTPAVVQGSGERPPTPAEIEAEVLRNVKGQPIAKEQPFAGKVEDLNLPEPFLRRIADRAIRASFEERYRVVVKDPEPAAAGATTAADPSSALGPALVVGLLVFTLAMAGLVGVLLKRRAAGRGA